jgi:iron complex outermembrane recepter protein
MIPPLPLLVAGAAMIPQDEEKWATIVVTAGPGAERVLPPTVEASEDELLERQPRSVAEALRGLPGVSARTNSRGETVARVRGSEERQTQVFLDGAPLAVPWDGRADIGIIPAGLIGAVRVIKGAAPVEFGTNNVAGAVDLRTRSGGERNLRAILSAGSNGFGEAAAVATLPAGDLDLTLAASALTRDSDPVASYAALPFSQDRSGGRTNTDLDSATLFSAARYQHGALSLRGYLLHFRAERGIAPESDRDPELASPRYWRYPKIEQTQLSLSSTLDLDSATALSLVGWRQWFGQRIDQYRDFSYTILRGRQQDEDDTLGGRAILRVERDPLTLRLAGTAQTSRHEQVDTALPGAPGPRLSYRQNLYTLGAEADLPLGPVRATLGAAYDRSENPLTGDKPSQPDADAFAFSAALRAPIGEGWELALSGGRRTRFPSARELFGEALGRFLPNSGLRPETAWLADLELSWRPAGLSLVINPFFSRTTDTISQRVVAVDGRNLRQRFNLSGSTSYGADLELDAELSPRLSAALYGTVLRARADSGDAAFRRLPQRPSYELGGALTYRPDDRLSLRAELRRVGPAVDLGPKGERAELPSGNELNLRGRYRLLEGGGGHRLFLTASIDNVTDDAITPQLGLPLPGRSFRIGLQLD